RLPLRPPLSRTAPRGPAHAPPGRSADPGAHPLPRRDRAEDSGGDSHMNLVEQQRALRQLRCSGMAAGLESRLLQAQAEPLAPIDFLSTLVGDELLRRQDRLLERRLKQAGFRDVGKTLDAFDFDFNRKLNRRPVEDWVKLLGDTAAVTALLDRLLHHAHVLTCGPRSWRTRLHGERAASGA